MKNHLVLWSLVESLIVLRHLETNLILDTVIKLKMGNQKLAMKLLKKDCYTELTV